MWLVLTVQSKATVTFCVAATERPDRAISGRPLARVSSRACRRVKSVMVMSFGWLRVEQNVEDLGLERAGLPSGNAGRIARARQRHPDFTQHTGRARRQHVDAIGQEHGFAHIV